MLYFTYETHLTNTFIPNKPNKLSKPNKIKLHHNQKCPTISATKILQSVDTSYPMHSFIMPHRRVGRHKGVTIFYQVQERAKKRGNKSKERVKRSSIFAQCVHAFFCNVGLICKTLPMQLSGLGFFFVTKRCIQSQFNPPPQKEKHAHTQQNFFKTFI